MNETSTILLLSIVGVWLFTSSRGKALLAVIKSTHAVDPTAQQVTDYMNNFESGKYDGTSQGRDNPYSPGNGAYWNKVV